MGNLSLQPRRQGEAVDLILTITQPGGAPLDPAGAYVDLPLPTGGSSSALYWGCDPTEAQAEADLSLIGIYTAEHDAAKVLAVAQALDFA